MIIIRRNRAGGIIASLEHDERGGSIEIHLDGAEAGALQNAIAQARPRGCASAGAAAVVYVHGEAAAQGEAHEAIQ